MTTVFEATDLVRTFGIGRRAAVDGVSFTLHAGDCLAIFGPNGAGKTTLLRMLGGTLRPTSGDVRLDGGPLRESAALRARVGIVSHHTMLYDALTARENVAFAATLYGVGDPHRAAGTALDRLGAEHLADLRVRELSRGQQQRVAIARAMVHSPVVLLADEPFTGLDAAGAASLAAMLSALRDGGGVLVIVTHHLAEGLALCTQAAIMREGRFVRHDSAPVPAAADYTTLYRELAADAG